MAGRRRVLAKSSSLGVARLTDQPTRNDRILVIRGIRCSLDALICTQMKLWFFWSKLPDGRQMRSNENKILGALSPLKCAEVANIIAHEKAILDDNLILEQY